MLNLTMLPRLKTILLLSLVAFALFYLVAAVLISLRDVVVSEPTDRIELSPHIAIFGASGTAGDGILKAAMNSADIASIQVITRRLTPRIEQGVAAGKIHVTLHKDYLDYTAIRDKISRVDTVFWAIGISSIGTDEKTYAMIHTEFPLSFLVEWVEVNDSTDISFHFISSSDISEDSSTMWVRQKIRAEKSLFGFARDSKLRVIAYRPDYIGPTAETATLGQNLLYWFFKPVGAAVQATQIGQAMIEVAKRGTEFKNGTKLNTGKIIDYGNTYSIESPENKL